MRRLILVTLSALATVLTASDTVSRIAQIDQQINEIEANLEALSAMKSFANRVYRSELNNDEIASVVRLQDQSRTQNAEVQKNLKRNQAAQGAQQSQEPSKTVTKSFNLANRLFERAEFDDSSVVDHQMMQVRTFKTSLGSLVSLLSLQLHESGVVTISDGDGNVLNRTDSDFLENKGKPVKLITYQQNNQNDLAFVIQTETHIILVRLQVVEGTKHLASFIEFSKSLKDDCEITTVQHAVVSRQKGRWVLTILDQETQILTSLTRNGMIARKDPVELIDSTKGVQNIKSVQSNLVLQSGNQLLFKSFKPQKKSKKADKGEDEKEEQFNCQVKNNIQDFTIDMNNNSPNTQFFTILSGSHDVTFFSVNVQKSVCQPLGTLKTPFAVDSLAQAGALLLFSSNERPDLVAFSFSPHNLDELYAQGQGEIINLDHTFQSITAYDDVILAKPISETNKYVVLQSTLAARKDDSSSGGGSMFEGYERYIPQLTFFIGILFTGWWQYRKMQQKKNQPKEQQKGNQINQSNMRNKNQSSYQDNSGVKNRYGGQRNQQASDSDDAMQKMVNKNRVHAGLAPSDKQKKELDELQAQIKQLENNFGGDMKNMAAELQQMQAMTKNLQGFAGPAGAKKNNARQETQLDSDY